ncbi:MAG: hypothetical protein V3S49_02070 [Thermodesulfobacteriota bacterium]
MLGISDVTILFIVFGICLFFVIVWIFKSEKARNIFNDEVKKLKYQLESAERERSILSEQFEESQDTVRELEESAELQRSQNEGQEVSRQHLNGMADRLRSMENENVNLKVELKEARGSLEEVFKAVHEGEAMD